MYGHFLFPSWHICECNETVWIFNAILEINENTFRGAHSTSFTMSVMRKCEKWQLTFKSGAHLIGNGYDAMALCDCVHSANI